MPFRSDHQDKYSDWKRNSLLVIVVGVFVVMELLRSLLVTEPNISRAARPNVFLFSGAEEFELAGARRFAAQSPFAHSIVAHINTACTKYGLMGGCIVLIYLLATDVASSL